MDLGVGLSEQQLDVRYYAHVLWRGRYISLAAAAVGLALGLTVAFLQTPEYRATTTLQIDPPAPTFMTVTDALMVGGGGYWQYSDYYNTQYKILRAGSLGAKVVKALDVKERPPFKGLADPGGAFMSYVSVSPIAETRLVQVSVTHPDPKTAALWVNTLASVYVKDAIASRVQAALEASQWLQERLGATQKSMRDAQERYYKAMEGEDLFVPAGSVSALSSSITSLNQDLVTAQGRRIELEAALRQVQDMRAKKVPLDALPQVAQDAQIAQYEGQITDLNVELSKLREKYKSGHPEVQRVQLQIAELEKVKLARAGAIVDGLEAELRQVQKREVELRANIERLKETAASQSRKTTELEALKKEAESANGLYEVLLQKLNETDIAASIRNNNVSVVEQAIAPTMPVRPRKSRMAGIGLAVGLVLGLALVLGRDYLDPTIRDPDEVERYLHLDLLAAVPRQNDLNVQLVTEAYQNLRTALIFARRDEKGQVVLVTGTAPQEGKTTTLLNLGRLLASSGERTIVVDCDLRRAQLHARLGLRREPGLTDLFTRHASVETLAQPTRTPNLDVITAGPLPPNPPALLGRKALAEALQALRDQYDWILIDSPPLASVTDALLVARTADHVAFVIQHNRVDKKAVKRHVAQLRKATPHLLGAVLNDIDIKAKGYYYYYYPRKDSPAAPAPASQEAETDG
jgi:succinoglycan biosynthesis transport protein ExoP